MLEGEETQETSAAPRRDWTGKVVLGVIALAVVTAGAIFSTVNGVSLPKSIQSKIDYAAALPPSAYVQVGQTYFKLDKTSFRLNQDDPQNKVVSFKLVADGNAITVTEQAYPEILVFDKLVGTMNEYDEVQARIGKVALTRPRSLNGSQTAVLSTYNGSSGVLLFAKPDHDLTKAEWTRFFNSLRVAQ